MKRFFILPVILIICFLSVNILDNCCSSESSNLNSNSFSSETHIENQDFVQNSLEHKDCLPSGACASQCHCGHLQLITFNKDYNYQSVLHQFNSSNQKIDLMRLAVDLFRPPIA